MRRTWTLVCVCLVACLAEPAMAQSVDFVGRVLDPQGAVVVGAVVRVSPTAGGVVQTAVSDSTGQFALVDLAPGVVVIEVARAGFRRLVRTMTLRAADAQVVVDFRLEVLGVDEAVIVTATGAPQALSEASKAVTVVDGDEILRRQEVTVGDAIRFAPGVQVRDAGGPGQLGALRIRGLRSDAAAVLVDGLRLRDAASTQADASGFFSNLYIVDAERVEVLGGSGSSVYGTNAVGGAVNIVSRPGGGPFGGEGQVEYGSLGQTRARGAVSGSALGQRVVFSAGAVGVDVADGVDGDDAARSVGAQGVVRYTINGATSITARFFGSSDRVATNASPTTFGVPDGNIPDATVIDAVEGTTFIAGRNDPDASRRSDFQTVAVRLERQQAPTVHWQASYQRVRTARTHSNGPLGPGFQTPALSESRFTGTVDTLNLRATLQVSPWLRVMAAYEFEREGYAEWLDDHLPAPDRLITESRVSQLSHALVGAAQVSLAEGALQLSVAGRAQGFRLSTPTFSTVGTANPYDGLAIGAPPRAVTGDVSASYFVRATGTKFRAHVGNAYRAPSLYERFGGGFFADPSTDVIVFSPFGDPRLAPDRYRSFDAGVDQFVWRDRVRMSGTAFVIDAESLTEFDFTGGIQPDTDPFGRAFGYLNGPGGVSKGVELAVDARPTRALRLHGAYTYTDATTDADLAVPGFFRAPGVFTHTVGVVVSHEWPDRLEVTADLFHGSESYTALFAAGRSRAYRFPGFTTAGVTAAYLLPRAGARPVRVYVKLDNLFDARFFPGGWRAPGRTGAVGVSVGF